MNATGARRICSAMSVAASFLRAFIIVYAYASNSFGMFSNAVSSVINPAWKRSVTAFFMVCIPSFVDVSITEFI